MKKGDRVVCVTNDEFTSLIINQVYTIINCIDYKGMLFIEVENEDEYGYSSYNSSRFKLLTDVSRFKLLTDVRRIKLEKLGGMRL